jgi:hypothetical protein
LTILALKTTRFSGDHLFFVKNFKKIKKIVKNAASGTLGNSGGNGNGNRGAKFYSGGESGAEERLRNSRYGFPGAALVGHY